MCIRDSNNSVSATGLTVQTRNATANTINIATGQTFTVNGPVTLGTPAAVAGTGTFNTAVNFTGGGNFTVSTTNTNFFVGIGDKNYNSSPTQDRNAARVDMTALGNFTYNTGATGTG